MKYDSIFDFSTLTHAIKTIRFIWEFKTDTIG